ncbi:GNAT family N-acetyltransferase [Phyllobacterium pellucidum]|uniref:GNAT family N-acetyltransferase n=1 Tax=Phyllobacterium pellucidum TaxID=2740464 RepID=UPI001D15D905|nr:GNAT family N-acetyltransferase [Phyllobacterium sp. T1018]UGY10333.1 GNAT family N-acetyltransferase [Phyllobacterium sp. T1018]
MNSTIRPAGRSDALNLAALSIQVWLRTYASAGIRDVFAHYVFSQFNEERLASELGDESKVFLVSEVKGHLVGYAKLALNARCPNRGISMPEIETLYVQEHFVGRGIGSALLDAVTEACLSSGHQEIWLTVNQENLRAKAFYERKSFRKVGIYNFELDNEQYANDVLTKIL